MKSLDDSVSNIVELSIFDGRIDLFVTDVLDTEHELPVHVMIIDNIVVNYDDFFDSEPE